MTGSEHIEMIQARAHAVESGPQEGTEAENRAHALSLAVDDAARWAARNQGTVVSDRVASQVRAGHALASRRRRELGMSAHIFSTPEARRIAIKASGPEIQEGTFPGVGPKVTGGVLERPIVQVSIVVGVVSVVGIGMVYLLTRD